MGLRLTIANQWGRKYDVDINRVIELAHEAMDRNIDLWSLPPDHEDLWHDADVEYNEWKDALPANEKKIVNHIELMMMGAAARASKRDREKAEKVAEFERETDRLMRGVTPGYVEP